MRPVRAPDLRPRQAIGAVGTGGDGWSAGSGVPRLPAGSNGLGQWSGPVLELSRDAALGPTRRGGLPGVWSHGTRTRGRLAQLEERRPYKAKVGGSSPSAPTDSLAVSFGERSESDRMVPLLVPLNPNVPPRPFPSVRIVLTWTSFARGSRWRLRNWWGACRSGPRARRGFGERPIRRPDHRQRLGRGKLDLSDEGVKRRVLFSWWGGG